MQKSLEIRKVIKKNLGLRYKFAEDKEYDTTLTEAIFCQRELIKVMCGPLELIY